MYTFVGYDDKAVYIAADFKHPDSKIRKQFSKRDKSAGIEC